MEFVSMSSPTSVMSRKIKSGLPRTLLSAAVLLLAFFPISAFAQGVKCGAAKDLVVQGLEHIKTGTEPEIADGLQLLKHANEVCPTYGDAWYYRSLFEAKLGHAPNASYALGKAKLFGSDAMNENANPFILAAPVQPGKTELSPVREKWALAIGISRFNERGLDLAYTSKDAKDFATLLQDPNAGRFKPSNVHVLSEKVTTRQLKEELNWLARMAQEDDLVVIFLASHGTARSMDTADVNYVVTTDTELQPQDSLFATSLAMVDLSDIVRSRIKARRTVILLDTCHSGAATVATKERALADSAPSRGALERISQGLGRAIVASSSEDQVSYEGAPYQNGYFTHFLLDALRQNGGMNNIEQVFAYVKEQVSKAVAARNAGNRGVSAEGQSGITPPGQTPVLDTSELGNGIVLGVAPTAARESTHATGTQFATQ
ncbi:MAG TPA: caspase family protein [Candidatus Acidoferrales bacterium]